MVTRRLFPANVDPLVWSQFEADGFTQPVCGIVYRPGQSRCGVPLGGIGTGCIDLDTGGTLGRCSVFNSFVSPRDLDQPFLALIVDGKARVLAKRDVPGTCPAKDVRYFGHFPVADLEYDLDGPIGVGLRAWAPFIPGDSALSNTPGCVFEVRLRNTTSESASGSVAFTFPGPSDSESGSSSYQRKELCGNVGGVEVVTENGVGYAIGAVNESEVRAGGTVGNWAGLSEGLPSACAEDAGASIAVDFSLAANEERKVVFVLTWYHPRWVATDWRWYLPAYASRFGGAAEVAGFLARENESLLQRILAWQEVIYAADEYPVWLREQLVNVMHTITEDAMWASDSVPEAPWCKPTGIFGLIESPRSVPHVAIPSDWYGCLPFVFFFPDLMVALLRAYAHYQLLDGEIPLGLGWYVDMGTPIYDCLRTTNSVNFVDLVGRLWERDRDEGILREFYPAVKRAIEFTHTLDRDGDGLPDLDPWPTGNQFYGAWHWVGTATHPNGYWLSALRIAERMARTMTDPSFEAECRSLFDMGSRSLEEKLWNGDCYLLYHDTTTGEKSDTILANQLSGEWLGSMHGLGSIFPLDRVRTVLSTVKRKIVPLSGHGVRNAIRPDGSVDEGGEIQSRGIFTGETVCLACTYAYAGDTETAEGCAFKLMNNIVFGQRIEWDLPNNISPDTGEVLWGTDFYQMMVQWALPMALSGRNISGFCASDGLVDRIVRAASQVAP